MKGGGVVLVDVGDSVAAENLESIHSFVRNQLSIEVVAMSVEDGDIEIADIAEELRESNDGAYIILIAFRSSKEAEHIRIEVDKRFSLINPSQLDFDPHHQLERRLERLAMRSVGKILGLPEDPDPFCVMHPYREVEQLDGMGRNFSPPWQLKFDEAAERVGLRRTGE